MINYLSMQKSTEFTKQKFWKVLKQVNKSKIFITVRNNSGKTSVILKGFHLILKRLHCKFRVYLAKYNYFHGLKIIEKCIPFIKLLIPIN